MLTHSAILRMSPSTPPMSLRELPRMVNVIAMTKLQNTTPRGRAPSVSI